MYTECHTGEGFRRYRVRSIGLSSRGRGFSHARLQIVITAREGQAPPWPLGGANMGGRGSVRVGNTNMGGRGSVRAGSASVSRARDIPWRSAPPPSKGDFIRVARGPIGRICCESPFEGGSRGMFFPRPSAAGATHKPRHFLVPTFEPLAKVVLRGNAYKAAHGEGQAPPWPRSASMKLAPTNDCFVVPPRNDVVCGWHPNLNFLSRSASAFAHESLH